jgi:PAS domain S-box-containing protein
VNFSARIALAMMALVALAAVAVGWVLARAFGRMAQRVKDKTISLEKEITEHGRTEAALEQHADSERLFSAAVQSSVDAIVTMTLDGIVTGWNPAAARLFGWADDEIVGHGIDLIVPEDRRAEVRKILARIRRGERVEHHETIRLRRDQGRVEVSLSVSPITLPSGAVIGACKIARDVTERNAGRKLLEHEVNERRRVAEVLHNTITSMQDAVLVADAQTRILLANPAAQRLIGDIAGMSRTQWRKNHELLMPDGITPIAVEDGPLPRAVRGETVENYELVLRRKSDGKLSWLLANGAPLQTSSSDGKGGVVVYRDITETKETERQLRQAQKMEAVGQLTGGIAHDFNNILTVITGTIEILAEGVADRPELAAITAMIDEAAERGSALTRHLLAFSRRQPLQPRETDINAVVVEAARLFRPTLGGHIEVESILDDAVTPALIDPNQLTTALLNLALNARDAMPRGGKLMLETGTVFLDDAYAAANAEVQPGHYAMIAVSDTGSGIPAAVIDKVFDPFFTTKEVGKGTGLGLSMVYGFIKQSGGHIKIYSEEGFGTTIRMYLPRASAAPKQADQLAVAEPALGGSETVLVVEDDALVRKYVVAQVHGLGYTTLAATNAAEALSLLDSGTAVDLLFTDVVIPGGMNGRELADAAVKRRAALKVLFTSGYAENALIHHGRLDAGVLLLPKPYRKSDLARMIRSALAA